MIRNVYIGCPVWGNKEWIGEFFSATARPKDFIRQYTSVLNTVEGNNTFYGLPKTETVDRWAEEAAEGFRFCFKFPREISHDCRLLDTASQTSTFLQLMERLGEQLGILFLQLPPTFDRHGLSVLENYLRALPEDFTYGVEMRHSDWFDEGEIESRLNELLERLAINRVMFDTTTLHAISGERNADVLEAQRKKPKMPARFTATAAHPFLRFVGHQTIEPNLPRLTVLADHVAAWLREGRTPYVCLHSPNDFHAPHLCRTFHALLQERVPERDLGSVPAWPAHRGTEGPIQLSLF